MRGSWLFWVLAVAAIVLHYVFEISQLTAMLLGIAAIGIINAYWIERYHKEQMAAIQRIIDHLNGYQD